MSTPVPPIADMPDDEMVPLADYVLKNSGGKGGVKGPRKKSGSRGG